MRQRSRKESNMLGLGLIGKVADLAGAVIDSKAVVKKAEARNKDEACNW